MNAKKEIPSQSVFVSLAVVAGLSAVALQPNSQGYMGETEDSYPVDYNQHLVDEAESEVASTSSLTPTPVPEISIPPINIEVVEIIPRQETTTSTSSTTTSTTTTIAPTTTTTVAATVPPETAPPETVAPETSSPSAYESIDCSADSMVIQAGMTFGEIADWAAAHCGISQSNLRSYNPGIDIDNIITGSALYLKPGLAPANSSRPGQETGGRMDCTQFGKKVEIAEGFTPYAYLKSIGFTGAQADRLVNDTSFMADFGINGIVGNMELLPTAENMGNVWWCYREDLGIG